MPSPHESRVVTEVSMSPSGMPRPRAMLVRVEVKQFASAAENSSSGFDSPPGPPSSDWVAVATESAVDAPSMRPRKPFQRSVADASSESTVSPFSEIGVTRRATGRR